MSLIAQSNNCRSARTVPPKYSFGARRTLLRRFPYLIIFCETETCIEIIAVAHGTDAQAIGEIGSHDVTVFMGSESHARQLLACFNFALAT